MAKAYKKVTLTELSDLMGRMNMAQDRETLETFAREVYGPKAHKITVEVEFEYNDEGSYDPRLNNVVVFDAEDNILDLIVISDGLKQHIRDSWNYGYGREHGKSDEQLIKEAFERSSDDMYGESEMWDWYGLPAVEGEWIIGQGELVKDLEVYIALDAPEY